MAISTPLGVKRTCPSCNSRFYDLDRRPANCPKCGHSHDPSVQPRTRRPRRMAAAAGPETGQDMLLQHMAKTKAAQPKPKKGKEEGVEDFEGAEAVVAEEIEDIEDISDIEALEELEDIEEEDAEEESLEESAVAGAVLVDTIDDTAGAEEEEEEKGKRALAKPLAKQKKKR